MNHNHEYSWHVSTSHCMWYSEHLIAPFGCQLSKLFRWEAMLTRVVHMHDNQQRSKAYFINLDHCWLPRLLIRQYIQYYTKVKLFALCQWWLWWALCMCMHWIACYCNIVWLARMHAWIKWGRSWTGHAARACMSTETTCKTTKATVIYLYYVFCSCSWANDLRANYCWSGTWTIQIWQVAHARNYIIMSCNILYENSAHDIIVNLTSNNTSYEMFVQTTCVKPTSTGLIIRYFTQKKIYTCNDFPATLL